MTAVIGPFPIEEKSNSRQNFEARNFDRYDFHKVFASFSLPQKTGDNVAVKLGKNVKVTHKMNFE